MNLRTHTPLAFSIALVLASSCFGCSKTPDPKPTTESAAEMKGPPQAAGMILLLKSAQTADATGFKNAFSKRLRDDPDQSNWEKNVGEAQTNLKKLFGDYRLEDFAFTYKGDDTKGTLTTTNASAKPIEVAVVKEGDSWRVDER